MVYGPYVIIWFIKLPKNPGRAGLRMEPALTIGKKLE